MYNLSDLILRLDFPSPSPWSVLPPELTSLILHRLGAFEMLESAQKVCRSWRDVCKDTSMWRKIDMRYLRDLRKYYDLGKMCRHAVDRSQGGLVQIEIWHFGTDELLNYIADSSRNLRSLKLAMCSRITDNGFAEAVAKLPLLEDLEVSYCSFSTESLKVVGKSCPNLKTLKLNRSDYCWYRIQMECDDDALAISETMPRIRHLQLFRNRLTVAGLNAILDNCPNVEHLDLRQCFDLDLDGDLEKRCSERIKVVRRPNDSIHDYPYDPTENSRLYDYTDYEYDSGDSDNYHDYYQYDNYDDAQYDNSDYDQYDIVLR